MTLQHLLSRFLVKPSIPSFVCQSAHFETEWYRKWADRISHGNPDLHRFGEGFAKTFAKVWSAMEFEGRSPVYKHRKMWEWCAIAQVLEERGQLRKGKRGCGFAVGQEPLSSLFAAFGADILATDLQADPSDMWAVTGQQVQVLDQIHWPNLIPLEDFKSRVRFEPADMRDLASLPNESFDFLWSSCSLEHLGTLEDGLVFIEKSTDLLKPGGVAVHTTEYNVSSLDKTLETGPNVIYRQRDLLELQERLRRRSATLHDLRFDAGESGPDRDYDRPPYYTTGRHHIKLELDGFVTTSILLVITRNR
jgi:SAM-dependent methyltransferase